jgi:hypothetical protein
MYAHDILIHLHKYVCRSFYIIIGSKMDSAPFYFPYISTYVGSDQMQQHSLAYSISVRFLWEMVAYLQGRKI